MNFDISTRQLIINKKVIYGGICSAMAEQGAGQQFMINHQKDQDGFICWSKYEEYKDRGCTNLEDTKYSEMINIHYSPEYTGGLLGWVTEIEDAYIHLEHNQEDPANSILLYSDGIKCKKVLQMIFHPSTKHLYQHVKDWMDYPKMMRHLKTMAHMMDYEAGHMGARKALNCW